MARETAKQHDTTGRQHDQKRGNGHHGPAPTNVAAEGRKDLEKHGKHRSESTMRAKWVRGDDRADRDGQTLATRDHAVVQRWAEERGGVPATVPGTEHDDHAGVLRFIFRGDGGDRLAEIGWQEWFRPLDDRNLVLLFQDRNADGSQSTFFRFDNPDREDG